MLADLGDCSIDLVYIDPPFNTGSVQRRTRIKTVRDDQGDRTGFQGKRYKSEIIGSASYADAWDDYMSYLEPKLIEAKRVLRPEGTIYFHIDYREAHYCKVLLDGIFGRENFLNEVIWAYDYGGRARDRWPAKHDTILVYAKNVTKHFFDQDAIERIPYMAPGLVTPEKAARGKLPTDVWWHTIVPTNGRERTGYPTQKPEGILKRVITASSPPGGRVLDFFAGSGTTGKVASDLGRRFILVDSNPEAISVMRERIFSPYLRVLNQSDLKSSSAKKSPDQQRLL